MRRVKIENFKVFDHLEVDLASDWESDNIKLILGDNGSGKSTLLQAIALPLALAMGVVDRVADFEWVGFVPGRYSAAGEPKITLDIEFDEDEINATDRVVIMSQAAKPSAARERTFRLPGRHPVVSLTLEGSRLSASPHNGLLQFKGRSLTEELGRTDENARTEIHNLPGLYWFDQFRNLGSSRIPSNGEGMSGRQSYQERVSKLRRYLIGWHLQKQTSKSDLPHFIDELERLYGAVFPGRRFSGIEQMPGVDSPTSEDFYFMLEDSSGKRYDIEEMSAGEQVVIPVLYEFVRQRVGKGIVLVDEVDLNLHPPAAQLFASQLPKIAPDCQFILTTHSEAVSSIFLDDEIFRLKGGRLCL